jgi:hypothetical protein
VEPTLFGDTRLAGSLVQVVGIREQHARARGFELGGTQSTHRSVGGDGHECGRLDASVGCQEAGASGGAVPSLDLE